jgi:hypothetical protein
MGLFNQLPQRLKQTWLVDLPVDIRAADDEKAMRSRKRQELLEISGVAP